MERAVWTHELTVLATQRGVHMTEPLFINYRRGVVKEECPIGLLMRATEIDLVLARGSEKIRPYGYR